MEDVVQLFSGDVDIKPKLLLTHYLEYLGFMMHNICFESKYYFENTLVNVVILSKDYYELNFEISNYNTIFICKDNYYVENALYIIDFDDNLSSNDFIEQFSACLIEILEKSSITFENTLLKDVSDVGSTIRIITNQYISDDLFLSFFTQSFVFDDLFCSILERLSSFSSALSQVESNDLIRYSRLKAEYESHLLTKKLYGVKDQSVASLISNILNMLNKNNRKQFRFLYASCLLNLKNNWPYACNQYADQSLIWNSSACFERARILADYANDYNSALYFYQWTTELKNDYFEAYFESGKCWYRQNKFDAALIMFEKTLEVLNSKLVKHLLSPIELEYFFDTLQSIIHIYKYAIGDSYMASKYEGCLPIIQNEIYQTRFLNYVYFDDYFDKDLVNKRVIEKLSNKMH